MSIPHICYAALGAAAAIAARGAKGSEGLRDAAVRLTAAGMRAADAVSAATQTIADEAADINAEAHRKARIDAAVKERLSALEEGIRAEVEAELDTTEAAE